MFGLIVAGCSTTPTSLTYDAGKVVAPRQAARFTVEIDAVTDDRNKDPNWLGAIRGGFGEPLKTITTEMPVKDVVKAGFADGLKARGLVGGHSQFALRVSIERFDCNQFFKREANARFSISVVQKFSGRLVYHRETTGRREGDFQLLGNGLFAEVEDLRKVANSVMQDAIDETLNDPQFLALLR
ncbi:hypothetical protein CU669_17705 [Paramagnetospirillum kuznetsovii]|uniref:Lipoprotein n=2 Tax=Paramagnetospirillum kuznetsovii TaxID=2053833 RepID=A0A364NUL0_9PROT|nr:hypothetical protein CU669_17705 [Paramagnetospirillum kuznetsovii]